MVNYYFYLQRKKKKTYNFQFSVNYELVTPGDKNEDAMQNAKYCISIARKLGCTIFLLPEDIVEVRSKLILTLVGSIMAVAINNPSQ